MTEAIHRFGLNTRFVVDAQDLTLPGGFVTLCCTTVLAFQQPLSGTGGFQLNSTVSQRAFRGVLDGRTFMREYTRLWVRSV